MQRKPSFPVANCNIKMPDCLPNTEAGLGEDENEQQQRRQQLINFGHSQWGFNNWNWSVTKQDMDFVDFANGKYCVGVVAFVSITVKSLDLHRENIGYATSVASTKGMAIYKSRKCAVTNALRETLLSFGGSVATELMEATAESVRTEVNNVATPAPESPPEAAPAPRPIEPKNLSLPVTRKDLNGGGARAGAPPPVARAQPMPVNLPSVPRVPSAVLPPPVAAPPVVAPVTAPVAAPVAARGVVPRNQNDAVNVGLESMSEEEARAERKRRQRLAQEEFRQKQMLKQTGAIDDRQDVNNGSSSFDRMLMDIPSQDLDVVEPGRSATEVGKRKSPVADESSAKRRANLARKIALYCTEKL